MSDTLVAPEVHDDLFGWRPLFGLEHRKGFTRRPRVTLDLSTLTAAPGDAAEGDDSASGLPAKWHGVLVVEGVRTLDHREIAPNALKWRTLPLPIMLMTEEAWGHDGAVIAGTIDSIDRVNNQLVASGTFDLAGEGGKEAARLVQDQIIRWVSIDLAVVSSEIIEVTTGGDDMFLDDLFDVEVGGEYDWWERVTDGEVMGATICPFPAFPQAVIAPEGMDLPEVEADNGLPTLTEAVRASAALSLPALPPSWWFDDPGLDQPTPLTITDEGRVFGHVAAWGVCHTGYPDVCTTPPQSAAAYSYFRVGNVRVLDGDDEREVRTGVLVMGTNHANKMLRHHAAADHYDNTGYGVADCAVGEDEHGIWIAGALRPDVDTDKLRVLRASSISGDWRLIGGTMELIGVLVVNAPGFPIPALAASVGVPIEPVRGALGILNGEQVSLVASGRVVRGAAMRMQLREMAHKLTEHQAVIDLLRPLARERLMERVEATRQAS